MLDELNELAKQQYVSAYEVETIYVALGDNEQAFQSLEKAYAEHSFHLVYLNVSPQFKSVRSDLRFQQLVQRVGLSDSSVRARLLLADMLRNDPRFQRLAFRAEGYSLTVRVGIASRFFAFPIIFCGSINEQCRSNVFHRHA